MLAYYLVEAYSAIFKIAGNPCLFFYKEGR